MRLTDLNPRWVGHGGDGITYQGRPVPRREKVAITFDCPCGNRDETHGRVIIEFANPIDGGPPTRDDGHTWERTGETFEDLTLKPSIQRVNDCRWHGFVTKGEVHT